MAKLDDQNAKVWVPRCAITFDPNALDDELKITPKTTPREPDTRRKRRG